MLNRKVAIAAIAIIMTVMIGVPIYLIVNMPVVEVEHELVGRTDVVTETGMTVKEVFKTDFTGYWYAHQPLIVHVDKNGVVNAVSNGTGRICRQPSEALNYPTDCWDVEVKLK